MWASKMACVINEHRISFRDRGALLFLDSLGSQGASQYGLPNKHSILMIINANHVFIGILMQGVSAKPVRVRSYWRVRNGRKEFVRAHYRRRQLTPGWFILELALYRIRGLEQCSRKPSHKGGFRHCLQARTPVRRPSEGQCPYRAPPAGHGRALCPSRWAPRAHLSLVMWLWPTCVGTGSLNQNKNRINILRNHLLFIPLSKATVDGRGIGLWIIERHFSSGHWCSFFCRCKYFYLPLQSNERNGRRIRPTLIEHIVLTPK